MSIISFSVITTLNSRILRGWTLRRILFGSVGVGLSIQAAMNYDMVGVLLGSYIAGMGLLNAGCAGGYCAVQSTNNL